MAPLLKLKLTVDEDHLGAVFEDQVGDSTVGQCDAHQVLTLQSQNLHRPKDPGLSRGATRAKQRQRKELQTQEQQRKQDDCAINPGFIQAVWSVGQVRMESHQRSI